jgi:hypothetical protein
MATFSPLLTGIFAAASKLAETFPYSSLKQLGEGGWLLRIRIA